MAINNIIYKHKNNLSQTTKKKKTLLMPFLILIIVVVVISVYFGIDIVKGNNFTFTQTDWSGGASLNIADHTNNQTGWLQYSSKDSIVNAIDTLKLSVGSQSVTHTSSNDFLTGEKTDTQVSGTNDNAIVELLKSSKNITTGRLHTCALKSDGTVYCWGYNNYGSLGDGTTLTKYAPVQVVGVGGTGFLTDVAQINSEYDHTCAVKTDGSVYCWGVGGNGRLGNGSAANSSTPVQVVGVGGTGFLTGITKVETGDLHTCAYKNDGTVYCWGEGGSGQLGRNSLVDSYTPVQVVDTSGTGTLTGVNDIYSGGAYMLESTALFTFLQDKNN